MDNNVVQHVLADLFQVLDKGRGEREARALYELLLGSYRARRMAWHEECITGAWELYRRWQHAPGGPGLSPVSGDKEPRPPKTAPPKYPIRLEKRGRNVWEFAWPGELLALTAKFNGACQYLRSGDVNRARRILTSVVRECPYFIDAYNYLAIIETHRDNPAGAENFYHKAYATGISVIPPGFRDRLPWGWVENRPFLRALHGLALARLRRGDTGTSGKLLEQLISLDPEDHLGARPLLTDFVKKG